MHNQVVVIQTVVSSTLGVVDEDGNVIQKHPVQFELTKLHPDAFREALEALLGAKQQLIDQLKNS